MASDGGFSTRAMGFDKNEVNEYIASLRKKMNEIEADKKANDEKTAAAIKTAETADERVKAAEKAGEEKAAAIQEKLDIATVKADRLNKQVDDLKKQLEEEKKKMTDMLKSGKGVNAEAQRAYTEVIEKAEADAKEIIGKAEETAEKIVADAESRRADADAKLASFMELLRGQIDTINNGYKAVNESAAELLGSKIAAAPIEVPDFAAMAKSAEPAPAEEPVKEEPKKEEKPAPAEVKPAKAEKAETPAPEPAKEEEPAESVEASFDDWGGNDLAKSILADETRTSEVPLVNPDASKDMFGADLFGSMDSSDDDMTDISAGFGAAEEEPVEDIKPMDNSDHAKATPDSSFASDLIAQTMTSAHLDENVDEDLLAAVRAQEEKFAVQPTVSVDELNMDDTPEPALSDEEELMKALLEAEKSLGSLDGAIQEDNTTSADGLDSDNPWADLQKQLEAMEQGGLGMDMGLEEPETPAPAPEPAAPSADDASIWNFGNTDSSGNSDDDMSSDAFGGFGGF